MRTAPIDTKGATPMTIQILTLRAVLDAVPAKGATLDAIARALDVSPAALRAALTLLLLNGLVFRRSVFRQPAQWVPTAQAKRMTDASDGELRTYVPNPKAGGSR